MIASYRWLPPAALNLAAMNVLLLANRGLSMQDDVSRAAFVALAVGIIGAACLDDPRSGPIDKDFTDELFDRIHRQRPIPFYPGPIEPQATGAPPCC